jgi:hypothetical protein
VIDLPLGYFGDELDELTLRSQQLVGDRQALIEQLAGAHTELHDAEQSDAAALAYAVREGGADPGTERTDKARAAIEALERQVNGLDDAQKSLHADAAALLMLEMPDFILTLNERAESSRADRIVALDELRRADAEGATATSLVGYLERLREVSDVDKPLPKYEARESRIDIGNMKRSNDRVPLQRILDTLADSFSEPVAGAASNLRHIAEQQGCPCVGIAIVTSGACMLPPPQGSPTGSRSLPGSLAPLGLTRIEWRRVSNWVAVLVSSETLAERGAETLVRELSPDVDKMFKGQARQVFVGDAKTEAIFTNARGNGKPLVDQRQIDENISRVRDPKPAVDPQETLSRERAERKQHERAQQEPVT